MIQRAGVCHAALTSLLIASYFASIDGECPVSLVGASLSWSLARSFSTNRQVTVSVRSAFDTTDCTSSCNFAIGSSPSSTCGDFGKICLRTSGSRSCAVYSTADSCETSFSNNDFTIQGIYDDASTNPSLATSPDSTASIGLRKIVYGEISVSYIVDSNSLEWLETWFSHRVVVVPEYKAVISLRLPIVNYESPTAVLPLFVPVPFYGFSFQLKAFEFDGHPMIADALTSGISFSDKQARNVVVESCCQCPSVDQAKSKNAFFDLAFDPHDFVGPAPSTLYDGPVLSNGTSLGSSSIDKLSSGQSGDIQRIRIVDGIFPKLWRDPRAPAIAGLMVQDGSASTTVETMFQTSKNPPTCGRLNTPKIIAPTITEYICPYNQIGTGLCKEIELVATGGSNMTTQQTRIIPAVGFPLTDNAWVAAESLTTGSPLAGVAFALVCKTCKSTELRQRCPCYCPETEFSQKRCWYKIPPKTVNDVGTFIVQCFVAVSRSASTPTAAVDSCYSSPVCIKIYVAGNKPKFVDPTPLSANSENDYGVLIKGRTDVPACMGYPMNLKINATDADVNDSLRIYVNDTENIFFKSNVNAFLDATFDCPASNGIVAPFYGTRSGNNMNQTSDFAIESTDKSIAAKFLSSVAFDNGYAVQNVLFTLNAGSGLVLEPKMEANRNVILCGRAFDSSRLRYGRWVGTRKFDLSALDFSFGDYQSFEQCWRINLQIPPDIRYYTVASAEISYSKNRDGVFTVPGGSGSPLKITMSASDINAQDRTQILLLGSTGLPVGASIVSRSCNATTVCSAQDRARFASDSLSAADVPSECSGIDFSILWNVSAADVGKIIKICAIPRDSSTLCLGEGPLDASSMGWYGNATCLSFNVAAPRFNWTDNEMSRSYSVFVGCNFSLQLGLYQFTIGYTVHMKLMLAPPGAVVNQIGGSESDLILSTVSWIPSRGTEGQLHKFCVVGVVDMIAQSDPNCFTAFVQKCKYCVSDRLVLETVRNEYHINTNWMHLWSLNADTYPSLGLDSSCTNQLNCAPDRGIAVINNPDLQLQGSTNKTIVWVGTMFKAAEPESLVSVAGKFHTTVKSLLSMNPEQESSDIAPSTEICVVPCNN